MPDYPTKLRNFKAWAKAMEEGATVGRPAYKGSRTSSPTQSGRRKSTRRKRRTFRRAKRKKKED